MPAQKKIKKTTIGDIAKDTGFSINTVSNALNGIDVVKPSTRDIILESANRLGYIPNLSAVSMRGGKTKTVALMIPDISSLYFPVIVKLLEEKLRGLGYNVIIMNTNEDPACEVECVRSAISKNVDGVIICPSQLDRSAFELMDQYNVPFVLLGRHFPDREDCCVIADDYKCGYMATDYLIKNGHRRIAYVGAPFGITSVTERRDGYATALRDNGIEPDQSVVLTDYNFTVDDKKLLGLFEGDDPCTAVFAFSDMVAWIVASQLINNGIRVPEDCSLVGVDNLRSNLITPFELTSVDVNKTETVDMIVKLLFNEMEGKKTKIKHVTSPTLAVGKTVKPRY